MQTCQSWFSTTHTTTIALLDLTDVIIIVVDDRFSVGIVSIDY